MNGLKLYDRLKPLRDADADGIREHDPLESIHHDFEGEGDYGDGVDDLIAKCAKALGR